MAEFRHVRRIMVSLWGERVGTIIPMDSRQETFAFQYDRKFLKSGIEMSHSASQPNQSVCRHGVRNLSLGWRDLHAIRDIHPDVFYC